MQPGHHEFPGQVVGISRYQYYGVLPFVIPFYHDFLRHHYCSIWYDVYDYCVMLVFSSSLSVILMMVLMLMIMLTSFMVGITF